MWGATERQFNEKIRAETVLGLLYRVKAFYKAISKFWTCFLLNNSTPFFKIFTKLRTDYIRLYK